MTTRTTAAVLIPQLLSQAEEALSYAMEVGRHGNVTSPAYLCNALISGSAIQKAYLLMILRDTDADAADEAADEVAHAVLDGSEGLFGILATTWAKQYGLDLEQLRAAGRARAAS